MLCSTCLQILQGVKEYQQDYKLHDEESSLRHSILQECNLCLLLADFFYRSSSSPDDKIQQSGGSHPKWPDGGIRFCVGHGDRNSESQKTPSFELNFFSGSHGTFSASIKLLRILLLPVLSAHSFTIESSVPESTASADSLSHANGWLRTCTAQHEKCKNVIGDWFLPTRLVYVRSIGREIKLRLCQGEDLARTTEYLTLSHCWADSVKLRLLLNNANLLMERVLLTDLNQVMRDAVQITSALGFEYIWIDSLCIIQDSITDWERESALMGQIYTMATVNIAATAFADGRWGLFSSHDAIETRSFEVELNFDEDTSLIERGHYRVLNRDLWVHGIEEAPLNSRGWVVQERLLSPRVLHFGETQLYWECQELQACEAHPIGLPPQMLTHIDKRLSPLNKSPLKQPETGVGPNPTRPPTNSDKEGVPKPEVLYSYWNDIVLTFSNGNLTYPSDKLVAISGLAKQISHLLGEDQYLAGMWRGDLLNSLTWSAHTVSKAARLREQTLYRAPSWSWASVDGEIIVSEATGGEELINKYHAEVLDACVEYKNPDADDLGQVTGGSLYLRGLLMRIYFSQPNSTWGSTWRSERMLANNYQVEVDLRRDAAFHLPQLKPASGNFPNSYLFCIPIRSQLVANDDHFALEGLILQPVGNVRGTYSRVGMFAMNDEKSAQWFSGENGEPLDPSCYQEFDGDSRYTFIVV